MRSFFITPAAAGTDPALASGLPSNMSQPWGNRTGLSIGQATIATVQQFVNLRPGGGCTAANQLNTGSLGINILMDSGDIFMWTHLPSRRSNNEGCDAATAFTVPPRTSGPVRTLAFHIGHDAGGPFSDINSPSSGYDRGPWMGRTCALQRNTGNVTCFGVIPPSALGVAMASPAFPAVVRANYSNGVLGSYTPPCALGVSPCIIGAHNVSMGVLGYQGGVSSFLGTGHVIRAVDGAALGPWLQMTGDRMTAQRGTLVPQLAGNTIGAIYAQAVQSSIQGAWADVSQVQLAVAANGSAYWAGAWGSLWGAEDVANRPGQWIYDDTVFGHVPCSSTGGENSGVGIAAMDNAYYLVIDKVSKVILVRTHGQGATNTWRGPDSRPYVEVHCGRTRICGTFIASYGTDIECWWTPWEVAPNRALYPRSNGWKPRPGHGLLPRVPLTGVQAIAMERSKTEDVVCVAHHTGETDSDNFTALTGVRCYGDSTFVSNGMAAKYITTATTWVGSFIDGNGLNLPNFFIRGLRDPVVHFAPASDNMCYTRASGLSACWGYNFHGRHNAAPFNFHSPTLRMNSIAMGGKAMWACGANFSTPGSGCNGVFTCVGSTNFTFPNGAPAGNVDTKPFPWDPEDLPSRNTGVCNVAGNEGFMCMLTNTSASILCVGNVAGVRTAAGASTTGNIVLIAPPAGATWRSLTVGDDHLCAIRTDDNTPLCWGGNFQPGLPSSSPYAAPSVPLVNISAGADMACGIVRDTRLPLCWGNSNATVIPEYANTSMTHIAAGGNSACGISTEDRLVCWGVMGSRAKPYQSRFEQAALPLSTNAPYPLVWTVQVGSPTATSTTCNSVDRACPTLDSAVAAFRGTRNARYIIWHGTRTTTSINITAWAGYGALFVGRPRDDAGAAADGTTIPTLILGTKTSGNADGSLISVIVPGVSFMGLRLLYAPADQAAPGPAAPSAILSSIDGSGSLILRDLIFENAVATDALVRFNVTGQGIGPLGRPVAEPGGDRYMVNWRFVNCTAPVYVDADRSSVLQLRITGVDAVHVAPLPAVFLYSRSCTHVHLMNAQLAGFGDSSINVSASRLCMTDETDTSIPPTAPITVRGANSVILSNVTITSPRPVVGCGGAVDLRLSARVRSVATLTNITVRGSTASSHGGALSIRSGTDSMVFLTGASISGTSAGNSSSGVVGDGGAVHLQGIESAVLRSISIDTTAATGNGGAMSIQRVATLTLSSVAINTATAAGGGGAIHADRVAILGLSDASVTNAASGAAGGCMAAVGTAELTITRTVMRNCTSGGSGGALHASLSPQRQYLLTADAVDSLLLATQFNITGARSSGSGGGVYIEGLPIGSEPSARTLTITLRSTTVTDAVSSSGNGGCVALDPGTVMSAGLSLDASMLSGCAAALNGGALHQDGSGQLTRVDLQHSSIRSSTARGSGGGVYVRLALLSLLNTVVSGNTAAGAGGGVYTAASQVVVDASVLQGNAAGTSGGGLQAVACVAGGIAFRWSPDASWPLLVADWPTTTLGVAIRHNTAPGLGGGVDTELCELSASHVVFLNNSAGGGGGLSVAAQPWRLGLQPLALIGNTATSDDADGGGGGMLLRDLTELVAITPVRQSFVRDPCTVPPTTTGSVAGASTVSMLAARCVSPQNATATRLWLTSLLQSPAVTAVLPLHVTVGARAHIGRADDGTLPTTLAAGNLATSFQGGDIRVSSARGNGALLLTHMLSAGRSAALIGGSMAIQGSPFSISTSTFNGTRAEGRAADVSGVPAAAYGTGGALALLRVPTATITNTSVTSCFADRGGALYVEEHPTRGNTGIHAVRVQWDGNTAGVGGGDIFLHSGGNVSCTSCTRGAASTAPYGPEVATAARHVTLASSPFSTAFTPPGDAGSVTAAVVLSGTAVTQPLVTFRPVDAYGQWVQSDNVTVCTITTARNDTGAPLALGFQPVYRAVNGLVSLLPFSVLRWA